MATALVLQTWFDIAIQHTGSASNAFALAKLNNAAVSDEIIAGSTIVVPADLITNIKEVKYLESKNCIPATGATQEGLEVINPSLGIGTMAIEITFIVS